MFIFIKTYVVSTVIAIFYLFHNGHTSNFNELSTLDELTRRLTPYSEERVIFERNECFNEITSIFQGCNYTREFILTAMLKLNDRMDLPFYAKWFYESFYRFLNKSSDLSFEDRNNEIDSIEKFCKDQKHLEGFSKEEIENLDLEDCKHPIRNFFQSENPMGILVAAVYHLDWKMVQESNNSYIQGYFNMILQKYEVAYESTFQSGLINAYNFCFTIISLRPLVTETNEDTVNNSAPNQNPN